MANKIQLRRDTTANWTSNNPILASGEIGIETDSTPQRLKIGNGADDWNTLPYYSTSDLASVVGGVNITVDNSDPENPVINLDTLNASDVGLGNVPNVDATDRSNHTGTQSVTTINNFNAEVSSNPDVSANTAKRSYPIADENKLSGIEDNATADQTGAEIVLAIDSELGNTDWQDGGGVTDHSALNLDDGTNPHGTTANDVGLGNVDNTSDADKPVSTATQTALDGKADSVHTHTKSDITDFNDGDYATAAQGATADSAIQPGDIDTLAELNGIITDATLIDTNDSRLSDDRNPNPHTHTASEITDFDVEVSNNADVSANTTHRGLTNNPHSVTAAQVGLGNVDNTSDADKPVSTATQTALDGKVDDAQVLTNVPAGAVFTDTQRTDEEIEDVVGAQFNHANHTNITAVYDDISGEVRLTGSVGGAGGQVDSVVGGTGITVDATDPVNPIINRDALTKTDITDFSDGDYATAAQGALADTALQSETDPVFSASEASNFVAGDKSKLDGIESGATQDQTGAEIVLAIDSELGGTSWQSGGGATNHSALTLDDGTNPHGTTASDVGLGDVDNTSDANKPISTATQAALDDKADTVHTHTKSDISDFDDADYATAAQGATADSAIQPGDIDTLSELNGILTDATLIDTADPRLSDNRDPNPHTHTLSEITDAGTSAGLDVAAAGDAAVGEVVKGDDTRLTDSRTPLAHTHTASEITDFDTEVANNTDVSTNTTHRGLTNNPHSVTAAQVGLGAVPNIDATDRANHTGTQTASTISDFDTEVSNNTTVQSAFTTANNNVTTINNLSSDDIGNDSGVFAPTVTGALDSLSSAIGSTVSADGSVTTHNDVTDAGSGQIITGVERTKLDGIEAGAEVNVNADWNAVGGDAEILNKPNIPDSSDDISNDSSVVGVTVTDAIDNLNSGKLDGVAGGTDISIDATDPLNPIINFTGASGGASDTIDVTQTGHGFSAGDVLKFVDNVTPYQLAQADSPVNAEVIGIVSSVTDVNNFVLQIGGVVEGGAVPSGTQGDVVFLSPTVAGGTTTTRPSIVGQIAKPIGILIDSGTKMRWVDFVGVEIAGAGAGGGLVSGDIDTLAKLNGLVTDATLIDTNDVRLSDARTPTAHTHTKSDITDFSDGDYATAAQGSTADSALQPGDIDTLAELNGVLTDATLIDTTDPRLSDARTPISHTHTGSEITDFPKDKSIYIENPLEIDNITLWRTNTAITITGVHGVVRGSSPSALFAIKYSTDRSVTGTDLDSTGFTITSSTTGNSFSSFTSPNIPAGSWIWLEGDTYSGTINDLSITINYTE
jgi:hypothetical protein